MKKLLLLPSKIYNLFLLKLFGVKVKGNLTAWGRLIIKAKRGSIEIGKNVRINSSYFANPTALFNRTTLYTKGEGKISIGDNVGISNSAIASMNSITIEDDVLIGGGCKIWDTDFHPMDYSKRIHDEQNEISTAPVLIKKGAFVGGSSIVLKGVVIGAKSIIGAGSVVTKSVPDGEIWAGNPARFIKKID